MLFSTTAFTLFLAIFSQGINAAPNGVGGASAGAFVTQSITPTSQYTHTLSRGVLQTPVTAGNGVVAKGCPPSNDIVLAIQVVTNVSSDINDVLSTVTTNVTVVQITKISATAVAGFTKIVADIGKATSMLAGTPVISGGIADTIVDVLVLFVKIHQALLNTVIGKHSIFAQFVLTAPIAAVLRLIEVGVDAFTFGLIDLIPNKSAIIRKAIAGLDVTVKSSISVYSQVCFPNSQFPTVMPTCIGFGL